MQAIEIFKGLFGVPRFFEARGIEPSSQQFQGQPAAVKIDVAIAWTGSLFVEIIQPLTPDSLYAMHGKPDAFSLAFHHICLEADNWEQVLAEFKDEGRTMIYTAEGEGYTKYGYWDGRDTIGHYIEFLYSTPAWKGYLEQIKLGNF